MKLLFILLIGIGMLSSAPDCLAQTPKKAKPAPAKPATAKQPSIKASVRGAASVQELGHYVYAALQDNNFATIEQYFPTDTDLNNTEQKTPDKDLQVVLEDHTTMDIQSSFRQDFDELQSKSIEQGITFKDLMLMEVVPGSSMRANRVMPVNLVLTNPSNETITLVFETLKINGRYFLFQHIAVKK